MAGSALSLNRAGLRRAGGHRSGRRQRATKHFVERTLLSYRLAGVDKDQATRDHLQALHEKATALARVQPQHSGGRQDHRGHARRTGRPARRLPRPPSAERRGPRHLTTDQPDMQPVMTFASSAALRERMFLAYNTRAYPANSRSCLTCWPRGRRLPRARLPQLGRPGHRRPDDGLGGQRAHLSGQADEASREGARREHELILEFARKRQPELEAIDITSRATGTSSSAARPSTSTRNPCGPISPTRRSRPAC
jgi:thimet oligopeptidase